MYSLAQVTIPVKFYLLGKSMIQMLILAVLPLMRDKLHLMPKVMTTFIVLISVGIYIGQDITQG
ncbi:hypothetical protein GC090_08120 [Pantoea sp. JZ29]|nr:hypothetical protein GC090_08120 [Pantoea sp. JZ29]